MEESPFDWDQAAAAAGEDGTDLYALSELLPHHQLTATATTTTTTTTTTGAAAITEDLHLPQHHQHHNQGAFAVWWIAPEVPCGQCSLGGLECRVIRTDDQTGFCCTNCVGLGWECSFADVPPQPMAPQPDMMMMMTDAATASSDWDLSELDDTPLDPSGPYLGANDTDMDLIRGMAWSGRPSTPAAMGGTHAHAHPYVPGHAYAPAPALSADDAAASALSADHAPEPGPDLLDSSAAPVAKATGGVRFSRESVKILKGWLASHSRHPYPTEQEKDGLIRQTGLSKIQISNWFVNARRRGKIQPPRSTSPMPSSWRAGAVDIPLRRTNTPAPMEHMNPLERWAHSPPENEPASATDIARALSASCPSLNPDLDSPFPSSSYVDDGSGRSLFNGSSASSAGASTSLSSRSSYSQASRGSFRSTLSALSHDSSSGRCGESRRSRRRRRKSAHRRNDSAGDVAAASAASAAAAQAEPGSASRPFQCTFCTEAFRTKHDWQRHEKSLHLSLERWVCTLEGPRCARPGSSYSESGVGNTSTGVAAAAAAVYACVFCGEPDPTDDHIETHNYSVCRDKDAPERVFYRKDHLNQHLRLVHNVRYIDWAMKRWKIASTEIRSRCGFCDSVLDSWNVRIDHLAEHFKAGSSMREWRGDWGFEAPVLKMVENSIPPDRTGEEDRASSSGSGGSGRTLQHDRRLRQHGNNAGAAPSPPPESPRNAFELIKLEMAYYRSNYHSEQNILPSDDAMQVEACRIIFASEVLSMQGIASELSWLRDLIMGNNELMQQARFGPLRSQAESRLTTLKVSGKDNLFEKCPLEQALADWVREKSLLGLCAMDHELQQVACVILGRVDEQSAIPDDAVSNWLVRLVLRSTHWLAPFRQRAHLPRSEDLKDELFRSSDPSTIDSTVLSYGRLESELAAYLIGRRRDDAAAEPTDDELQRRARVIIYGNDDDGWNQTAADDEVWLAGFRSRHPQAGARDHPNRAAGSANEGGGTALPPPPPVPRLPVPPPGGQGAAKGGRGDAAARERTLVQDLRRFVLACMSPNSPSQHIPTDRELQHQARWILYDCDDPGNRTPADNTEWLRRFKLEIGMPLARGEAVTDATSHQPAGQAGGAGQPGPVGLLDPLLPPLLPPLLLADPSANPAAVPGFDVGSIDDFMDEDIFGLEELI